MSTDLTPDPTALTRVVRRVRQTRDFRPDPVPQDVLTDILQVARWTGSVSNRQPWTFIVVTDAETKKKMAELAPNTPHIGVAPVVIVLAWQTGGAETDSYDEGRISERIMIAAEAHGLASGIGRARDEAQRQIADLLGVPQDQHVRTMVSIGYPTEEGAKPKSPHGQARKPLDELVRQNRYS
jgi:nitroreductase